jgi:hypothetical protein
MELAAKVDGGRASEGGAKKSEECKEEDHNALEKALIPEPPQRESRNQVIPKNATMDRRKDATINRKTRKKEEHRVLKNALHQGENGW